MTSAAQMAYLDRLRASMEKLSTASPSFKGLLYGASGVGKTVGSMQIAQTITGDYGRILYLDTAEGWVSLQNHPELKERTDRMQYVNLNQIEALCMAMREKLAEFSQIKTVIWDEVSSAADTALDEVVKYRANLDRSKDPDTPTMPDFNTTTSRVRKGVFDLLTVPGLNVILVSHSRQDKDNRGVEVTRPSFLPKLGQKIKQPLHLMAHMSGNEVDEKTYRRIYQVHPTRTIDAKTRVGGLKPQVEYPELIEKITGWMAKAIEDNPEDVMVPDHDPEMPVLEPASVAAMQIEGE